MHRMIPCLASIEGYSSSEIVVKHHPRQHGVSKYGIKRFSHGFFDMITVYLIRKYKDSPMHFFGGVCGITASIGGVGIVTSIIIPSLVAPFAESIMAASFAMIATSPIMLAIGFTNELNISGKGGALESPVARDSGKIRLKKKGNIVKFPVPQKNASISENSTSNYTHNAVIRIDNSEDRECYISHLENAHYEPVVAKNWKDAVKLAKLYNAPIFADLERTKSSSKREMNIELRNAPDTTVIFCDDTNKSLYFGKSDPRLQYKNNLTPFPAGDFGAA